jgi:Flp pilus assembly protein TadB
MDNPLLYTLLFIIGLLLISRRWWLYSATESENEAQARVESLLEKGNLEDISNLKDEEKVKKSSLLETLAEKLDQSRILQNEEGRTFLENMERWLIQAGLRNQFNPTQAISYALSIWALGIGIPLIMTLLGILPVILMVPICIISAAYPPLKLRSAINERQDVIKAEVPFFIQQLHMILSTGMATIDEAIVRLSTTSKEDPYDSVLAAEFAQAQVEYRLGAKTFEVAVRDVGFRSGVPAVENLCEAMIQGYKTGSEMDQILLEYSAKAQETWRQDMRALKNKKEPLVTLGLVITMFGAFTIWATPLLNDLINSFTGV